MESKLSWEVVHAAGVHQTQCVPHRLGGQHALTRDRADAAISQGGCHDTGALAGHLDGAELGSHTKDNLYNFSIRVFFHSASHVTAWWGEDSSVVCGCGEDNEETIDVKLFKCALFSHNTIDISKKKEVVEETKEEEEQEEEENL